RKVRVGDVAGEGAQTSGRRLRVTGTTCHTHGAREGEAGGVARRRRKRSVAAPLDTHVVKVAAGRFHDTRFDQHLWSLSVERPHQALDLVQVARYVAHDHHVGAV